jgi:hypothetical protein
VADSGLVRKRREEKRREEKRREEKRQNELGIFHSNFGLSIQS